jgi:ABC-type uncharacterized transport system involved in gliding motility auxiliary subunit
MKSTERWLYSIGGVIAVFVALVAVNYILGLTPARIDLTQGKLYTLSDGTRKVLGKLEAPVKVRFYFNQGDANVPVAMRVFAGRVDDLLNEMRAASNGKLVIEKLNPQPDSDAEDSANLDGIEAQDLPTGDKFYLGLTVSFADQKLALPVLSPNRERLLEYDIARAIARATTTKKPIVGVMSPLPVFGMPGNPMMMQMGGGGGSEPQIFISELKRDFDVKRVSMDVDKIEDDIKTLVVIHPRGISEQAQFALDQFVLRGGKLVVFLDPYAYFDQMPGMMGGQGGSSSNLEKLLKAWGYSFDPGKIVLDMKYMAGSGPRAVPTVIQLDAGAMSKDDVATSQLGTTLLAFAGAFNGKPADGLTESVLMHTSPIVKLVDSANAMARGEEAVRGFQPDNKEHPLALRLTGKFKTAFPDGRPAPPDAAGKDKDAKPKAPAPDFGPALKESQAEGTVVLVADSDMLNDGAAVQIQDIFGQKVAIPINGNLAFIQGLVEQMAGDSDLIHVRSRATASRPFTVVKQMEAEAAQAYLGKIKQLEDSLQETRKKLESLQKTKAPAGGGAILSPEQQAEVENFRKRAADTRRELKEVRRELRSETEALEFWTKVFNIAVMPLLVALAGIAIAIVRRRRRAAR